MKFKAVHIVVFVSIFAGFASDLWAQQAPWSVRMADSFMKMQPDSILVGNNKFSRWDYESGLMYKALERVWHRTGDGKYIQYVQHDLDHFVREDGSIRTYKLEDYNLDMIAPGHALLTMSQLSISSKAKYRKAADLLRHQLEGQPRTNEGGYWHKKRYPSQMWLDGLFMAEPFSIEYATLLGSSADKATEIADVLKQFELIQKYARDPKTGLIYHGYDESKQQRWANPQTGQSPNFWGRAMGWYAMALVDVLDFLPETHPDRPKLVQYLRDLMSALVKYQDAPSGCWRLVVDQGTKDGNYLEASATGMYVYTLLKGIRLGYLPASFKRAAQKGFAGMMRQFIEVDATGLVNLNGTVSVGGLGGEPYRDGSLRYYLSEPIRKNDLKGYGAFIMANVEWEIAQENGIVGIGKKQNGKAKTVTVDTYFNNEYRTKESETTPKELVAAATKEIERFHYTWEDKLHSGFWFWGNTFRQLGAKTTTLPDAPTAANLRDTDVYIIVDPDTPKETANPHYIEAAHVAAIREWVSRGGVLVLMANDPNNCELPHFNELAKAFGITFSNRSRNMVQGVQFDQGAIQIPSNSEIFKHTQKVYLKEISILETQSPASAVVREGEDTIMAVAKLGRGTVFAVGDPWLYNEYVDGRRIPTSFQNFQAGKDLAEWLLKQVKR